MRFQRLVRGLSNNKAPGPDNIPNELIKNLPDGMLRCMHELMILQYMTGTTPSVRKTSHTCLLYKKSDPHDLKNWRPISLADTRYKLWTGLLADCLSSYAEHFDIISSSQEGFRAHHNTIRQMQNALNIISDAKLTGRDLWMLYVDFSSAFNTIDHDKLLQIMYDLGFPIDSIHVIQDLYTNANTIVTTPVGNTDRIEIERGTIQGDTLSPFLFLIFIEPMLRWLQSGGRGYSYGYLAKDADHHSLTTAAGFRVLLHPLQLGFWLFPCNKHVQAWVAGHVTL